jgi:probable LLM family oxidoreductase
MELGIMSFADMQPESSTGSGINAAQRLKDLLEEIQLADQLGLDIFGLGEHHRADYAVSAPAVVLAAAAPLTQQIKLSSAVTVLSSDDPIRVYQQFATLDLLSEGRAEIMAGRGSFIESFPLFGYQLSQYDALFTKKLELLLRLQKNQVQGVYPQPLQPEIPVWLAAGGTPASAVRAATLGLPLMLAIIGGFPAQFVPFVNLYRDTAIGLGRDVNSLQIGVNNHMFIGEDSQKAADDFYPYYAAMMNRVGQDRGWPPLSRQQFEQSRSSAGALMVGSVQQVIDKILYEHELFGFTRFLAQGSLGQVPHAMTMKSIELFGTQVAPAIRKALS